MSRSRLSMSIFLLGIAPVLFALVLLALATPTLARAKPPWRSWVSTLNRDHALVGRIWSVQEKRFITPLVLRDRLAIADFILLGETHDNPDHHRLQAWLVSAIALYDRRPAVVMEMIGLDQEPALQAYLDAEKAKLRRKPGKKAEPGGDRELRLAKVVRKRRPQHRTRKRRKPKRSRAKRSPAPKGTPPGVLAAGLGPTIGWDKSGWPDWKIYQPIARAAFAHRLVLAPGNPARDDIKRIGRKGLDALPDAERHRLVLDRRLAAPLRKALTDALARGHCDLVPRAALGPMRAVQRYRDATMADQLMKAGVETGAILIAGDGHVRGDYAVPWYISRRDPTLTMASVMLIEVDGEAKVPADLIPETPGGYTVAHYIWFTPRTKRPDPCEALRKRFGKTHKPAQKR